MAKKEPAKKIGWQEAQERLLRLLKAGQRFTSQRELARRLSCSLATINKAVKASDSLKAWAGCAKSKGTVLDGVKLQSFLDTIAATFRQRFADIEQRCSKIEQAVNEQNQSVFQCLEALEVTDDLVRDGTQKWEARLASVHSRALQGAKDIDDLCKRMAALEIAIQDRKDRHTAIVLRHNHTAVVIPGPGKPSVFDLMTRRGRRQFAASVVDLCPDDPRTQPAVLRKQ